MNSTQRRMEIFQALQKTGSVTVSELAETFNVTSMTIRRDLALFEKQGLVTTNYGGATLNKGSNIEPSFVLKQTQMSLEKNRICEKASELIPDGSSIIIDCGTTPLYLMNYLMDKKELSIITNSWPLINFIPNNSKHRILLAPGEYSEISAGAVSAQTIVFFENIQADFVFISTQGFDPSHGATVPTNEDAAVKAALLKSAKQKILLADSSKFGQRYLFRHASPHDFDQVVTDSHISEAQLAELERSEIHYLIAKV